MKACKRVFVLLLVLLCIADGAFAAKKEQKNTAREITRDVVQDIPETIQQVLDLANEEWLATEGKNLKDKNKFTEWRGKGYKFSWCGGYVTWCMLQLDVPQEEKNKTKRQEVEGIVHVKEAGVGKLFDGYERMNRLTRIPQKGFVVVYGTSKKFGKSAPTPYYHVGLVYDVEKLSENKYRLTTLEGAVTIPKKNGLTIRKYVRDYTIPETTKDKEKDLTLVPEEERTEEETDLFTYHYSYDNKYEYVTIFLMPWIPEENSADS